MGRLQRSNNLTRLVQEKKRRFFSPKHTDYNFLQSTWENYLSQVGGLIPILIVCHNNGWMVHRTVMDLFMMFKNLQYIIVDNASSSKETIDYLAELEELERVRVIRLQENHGPYIIYHHPSLAEYRQHPFLLTDPDLDLSRLPEDTLEVLFRVGTAYGAYKTGLALDISTTNTLIHDRGIDGTSNILDTESGYWRERLSPCVHGFPPEFYQAPIDTTFCYIFPQNEGPVNEKPQIRVAGSYTVFHLPWIKNYIDGLTSTEFGEYFLRNDGRSTVSNVVRRYRHS